MAPRDRHILFSLTERAGRLDRVRWYLTALNYRVDKRRDGFIARRGRTVNWPTWNPMQVPVRVEVRSDEGGGARLDYQVPSVSLLLQPGFGRLIDLEFAMLRRGLEAGKFSDRRLDRISRFLTRLHDNMRAALLVGMGGGLVFGLFAVLVFHWLDLAADNRVTPLAIGVGVLGGALAGLLGGALVFHLAALLRFGSRYPWSEAASSRRRRHRRSHSRAEGDEAAERAVIDEAAGDTPADGEGVPPPVMAPTPGEAESVPR